MNCAFRGLRPPLCCRHSPCRHSVVNWNPVLRIKKGWRQESAGQNPCSLASIRSSKYGREDRNRTCNLVVPNHALCQIELLPENRGRIVQTFPDSAGAAVGFEPTSPPTVKVYANHVDAQRQIFIMEIHQLPSPFSGSNVVL